MLNKNFLFANGESRLNRGKSTRRPSQPVWRSLLLGLSLLGGTLLPAAVSADTPSYTIYLRNSQGVLQDETEFYGFQQGHIFSLSTGAVIGSVPNPQTGVIVDANGNAIGDVEQGA